MTNVRDHATFYLTFGRQGKCQLAHGGPLHWTGHSLFHELRRICRHREIGQRTHRSDYLTEGENEDQCDMPYLD